jgi:hypothetical protein
MAKQYNNSQTINVLSGHALLVEEKEEYEELRASFGKDPGFQIA